ncbi:MAG: hypothetical protein LH477_01870 [Nocardioides sp.]|nr:hypothetical protein [Nocardioides sp.]
MSATEDHDASADKASQAISSARAAEHAIQHLCRTTLSRPKMTPAEVDVVLAHLADAAAALPQAARQLGDILEQTKDDHVLKMDTLTEIEDPDLAIDTARHHPSTGSVQPLSASIGASTPLTTRRPTSLSPTGSQTTPKRTRRASRRRSHGQRTDSPRPWGAAEPDRAFGDDGEGWRHRLGRRPS